MIAWEVLWSDKYALPKTELVELVHVGTQHEENQTKKNIFRCQERVVDNHMPCFYVLYLAGVL